MVYFIDAFKYKYAQFDGRARREEYWMFQLFYVLSLVVMFIVLIPLMMSTSLVPPFISIILIALMVIISFIPNLAVTVRRFHDIDKSGWWLLIGFVPLGGLVTFIFTCLDSTPGENQYGPNPKEIVEGVDQYLIEEDLV